jgi:uncharacterized protein YwgA
MKRLTNLAYSDDPCSAFMTAVVASFERQHGDRHYLGRTAIQKLVYFTKALGVPVPCSFEIYTYGPYSDTVTFSIDSLMADDVLIDKSTNPRYSAYRLGKSSEEILSKYDNVIRPHLAAIDSVVGALGTFPPEHLELVATIHFIHHRLKGISGRSPDKVSVLGEFRRVKGKKFSSEEVESFYEALRRARLI